MAEFHLAASIQAPAIIQAGLLSRRNSLLRDLDTKEPLLMLLATPVLFPLVAMFAVTNGPYFGEYFIILNERNDGQIYKNRTPVFNRPKIS